MRTRRLLLAAGIFFGLAAALQAQTTVWWETFDSYNLGPWAPQGGWEEWSGSTGVNGDIVSDFFLSEFQVGRIIGDDGVNPNGDDMVYDFANLPTGRPGGNITDNGVWALSVMTYVPTGVIGQGYVIVLNTYPAVDSPDWSLQCIWRCQDTANFVQDASGNGGTRNRQDIQRDKWVNFVMCVDLDADGPSGNFGLVSTYYGGGKILEGGYWGEEAADKVIAAIDLYADEPAGNPVTEMYFDDLRLEEIKGPECVFLDMSANPANAGDTMNISIDTYPALAGAQAAIFVWQVNGFPFITPLLLVPLNASGKFDFPGTVPPGVPSSNVGFRALAVGSRGLVLGNLDTVYFP